MLKTVYQGNGSGVTWLDITDPQPAELEALGAQYGLNAYLIEDSLEPRHLPKLEKSGDMLFVVLRAYDERLEGDCDSVQQLTRKIAVFMGPKLVITVHRGHMRFFDRFLQDWPQYVNLEQDGTQALLVELMLAVAETYQPPLDRAESTMDRFEYRAFHQRRKPFGFKRFYRFKRTVALIKKMLRMSHDLLQRMTPTYIPDSPRVQDLREAIEAAQFQADELVNDATSLLNTFFGITAHRNNEIFRVLTIFSVFFLPLTFIAGIYGMNFDVMPELQWTYGYVFAWATMIGITVGLFFWMKRNRWL